RGGRRARDQVRSPTGRPSTLPRARPAMKTDRTMATIAAVTPNRAMVSLSHTTWQSRAQNPETVKKRKNQRARNLPSLRGGPAFVKVAAIGKNHPHMPESAFPDLRAFLEALRRRRDLAVVEAPVDARLEAAEIHRRLIAAGGPALLFTNVRGADFPLVTNLFGTRARAELAFGSRPHW